MQPTFYEFFAGGGMARAGLSPYWRCLFANDFDAKKAETYRTNWGCGEMVDCDIHTLSASDLPGRADLAWASFPCQDLSLAGNGAGLAGERSGAFWGFWNLMSGLRAARRAPRTLVLENVGGTLSSHEGRDFRDLCRALSSLGYVFGTVTIDAVKFLPQSRPRLFFVAVRMDVAIPPSLFRDSPDRQWATDALRRAHAQLAPDLKSSWRWWDLPTPSSEVVTLSSLIMDEPNDVAWHTKAETGYLLRMMSDVNRAKVSAAKEAGVRVVGTIYRRTRHDETGAKVQRAEVRFDGVAGCLRTSSGGSSRQTVIVVEGNRVRTRLLSAREAARLMGLPDSYILPTRYNDAYHLAGDGLAVPVVAFLRDNILTPIAQSHAPLRVAAE